MLDLVALREECSVRDAAAKRAEWFGVATVPHGKGGGFPRRPAPKKGRPPEQGKPAPVSAPAEGPEAAASVSNGSPSALGDPCIDPAPPTRPAAPNRPRTFELKLDPDHPWLAAAGILPETVGEFGLGFCSKGMMARRICVPIRNSKGELIGYAGHELLAGDPLQTVLCHQAGLAEVFFVPGGEGLAECLLSLLKARE
jgi:hypothetical protein